MGKDWHSEGEKDAARDSSRNSFVDIVGDQIFGGSYNPPSNKNDKAEYQSGWNNTKEQNRNK